MRIRGLMWRYLFLGGVCFWLPDVAYHCVAKSEDTLLAIGLLTLGMPLAVVFAWLAARGRRQNEIQSISLSMMLGVWLLGPTMIMLGLTCLGAGFRSGSLIANLAWLLLFTLVPFYLLIMAGLDFTILGLLLGTFVLLMLDRVYEKGRPLLPPERVAHL